MKIVDGTAIPPGERGFLFAKFIYEEQAQAEDRAPAGQDQGSPSTNRQGHDRHRPRAAALRAREQPAGARAAAAARRAARPTCSARKLQQELGGAGDQDVGKLLAAFFKTDDGNFARRYKLLLRGAGALAGAVPGAGGRHPDHQGLHQERLRAVGQPARSTAPSASRGWRQSPQAGELNLMDLVSFRELYGFLTDDKQAGDRRAQGGRRRARTSTRENAEAELFGTKDAGRRHAAAPSTAEATPGLDADAALSGLAGRLRREELAHRVYDPKQLEQGVVLNAAVILQGPRAARRDHRAPSRRRAKASGTAAQGDLLAEGLGHHRAVRHPGAHRAVHRRAHHLRGGAGHHQQRAGDGHARAGAGDRHACGRSGPSGASSSAC